MATGDDEKGKTNEGKLPGEGTPPEDKKPLSPEEQLKAIQEQLAEAQKRAEQFEGEAKSHRQHISQKDRELEEARRKASAVDNLIQVSQMQSAMIAEILDKQAIGETDKPETSHKAIVDKTFQEIQQKEYDKKALEAQTIAKGAGFDIATAPELEIVRLYFEAGKPDMGLMKLRDITSSKPKEEKAEVKPQETVKEMEERIRKEERRKVLEEKGLITSEGAMPSGTNLADTEFLKKFGSGDLPMTKANKERYEKINSN